VDSLERRVGVVEGNLDIRIREHHRVVKFYYKLLDWWYSLLDRVKRIEERIGIRVEERSPDENAGEGLRAEAEDLLRRGDEEKKR
jgi:hypothetical protein